MAARAAVVRRIDRDQRVPQGPHRLWAVDLVHNNGCVSPGCWVPRVSGQESHRGTESAGRKLGVFVTKFWEGNPITSAASSQ